MINQLRSRMSVFEFNELFDNLLQQAMMLNKTKCGVIQFVNESRQALEIEFSYGLSQQFLDHFKFVTIEDGSVCGRALQNGKSVFIADLMNDELFAPHRKIALQDGIHSVQSSPVISSNGTLLAMISTHFKLPRAMPEIESIRFETFCKNAAVTIERYLYEEQRFSA